ncbi:RND transporter [Paramagnetospirillum marisnigri]|uniref:RND transporter n=1 Tax=Paramagnetospirillum marisnigri TaxID=1285242 RepID=A0A178MQT7_9PROT|nr:efflux transporter outer membrane subunit [Paramagnetospirillum marisnigri]OAN50435.1 RND transporter [Paramagnetospirillum marisnigri]
MRVLPLAVVALALTACSVGDPYQRPDTKPPVAWKNAPAQARGEEWPSAEWWRRFGSLRLNELMWAASLGNFDIQVAMAKVRQADAEVAIMGAPLLPSLSASAGSTRSRASMAASSSSSSSSSTRLAKATHSTSTNALLTASYEIDFWGKNAAGLASAEAAAQASRFDQQTVMLTAQASVATTYFSILGLQERLRLARDNIANAESVLQVYRDRFGAGMATSLDVAQQESVVANQRAVTPPLEQQLRQDINALAILTGRLPEEFALEPELLDLIAIPTPAPGLPSELLGRRPDVQAAEASLRAANANIAVARAAWFPSLSLTGQAGFQSLDFAKMMTHSSLLWSVASSVTQTIFDGGKIAGNVEQKRARQDELAATYRKSVASAFSDVENALIAMEMTTSEVEAQRNAEAAARRAYDIARSLMAAGTVDITTVLNTQKTLFASQDALAQARLSQLQAVVGLYKAMGGGWQVNVVGGSMN